MANPSLFTSFNFKVNIHVEGDKSPICDGEFSECDGLEMNLAPKTIREGGNNTQQIHLPGPVSYGQITLKRGMSENWSLWEWFEKTQLSPGLRASGEITLLSPQVKLEDKKREQVKFHLTGCLPIKLKAPSLNAKDGQVAIEEIQIAYETLYAEKVKK